MAKRRLSRSKRNVARRAAYARKKKLEKTRQVARQTRRNARSRSKLNPLERAAVGAREYLETNPDAEVKVFFLPKNRRGTRARWSVASWRKFMREEKYRESVSEILLSGDFVLGVQGDDGDIEDRLDTLIEGV